MKLSELLKDGQEAAVRHPIVGNVGWGEPFGPGSGYVLFFLKGPEQGKTLVADATVLFDDRWENITALDDEIDRLNRLKEEAVRNLDFEKAASYRDEVDALKRRMGRKL